MQPHFSHQNEATLFDPLEIVLAKIGLGRQVFYHTARSGCPERMRLALDILEGQNFARKNHHGVGPRRAARQRRSICPLLPEARAVLRVPVSRTASAICASARPWRARPRHRESVRDQRSHFFGDVSGRLVQFLDQGRSLRRLGLSARWSSQSRKVSSCAGTGVVGAHAALSKD
jgi:hypothetical protein